MTPSRCLSEFLVVGSNKNYNAIEDGSNLGYMESKQIYTWKRKVPKRKVPKRGNVI